MCGRFTLILDPAALREDLDLGEATATTELAPRYNIAPTQPVAVVADAQKRAIGMFRWGLIPSWAKDPAIGNRLINARAETLQEKPSFRTAFNRRRCLILADGFYEWQRPAGKASRSQPYYFRLADGKPFAFAGLWDLWQSADGSEVPTCTIITTQANAQVGRIHDRMPVILTGERLWEWLDPRAKPADLQAQLRPYAADLMTTYAVSPAINSPAVDTAELIEPVSVQGRMDELDLK
jgi:putative SOS response-associated peptidase YedK